MSERITNVAVRYGDKVVQVPRPYRHHNILQVAEQLGHRAAPDDQGFVTDTGRFVTRAEAGRIAIAAGQVESLIAGPDLYSEDLF